MPAEIILFPIRHHSPACAWHVERLIAERRPRAVLIEGPRDATALIPQIGHTATKAPVAVYTTFVDTRNLLGRAAGAKGGHARFAAYYPLADYSPELAAIRGGLALGADVRFVDLSFPAALLAERAAGGDPEEGPRVRSLLDEGYFRHSRFLAALCQKTGSRDADDLWDHLYESSFQSLSSDDFMRQVEVYCALSRADYTAAMLAAEGHLAREAAMAQEIAAEATRGDGVVLVVTGGFHTPGLRELLEQPAPEQEQKRGEKPEGQVWLLRYGFAQLDRLNGYSSGMPSPAYYQRVWEQLHPPKRRRKNAPPATPPGEAAAAEFIVELGRLTRSQGPGLSAADEVAALSQARLLAGFRGHAQPTREDLLDGIRSAMVKGLADAEGALLLRDAYRLLAGDRIGVLPPGTGVAPLVEDFRRSAAELRVDIKSLGGREIALDLYRNAGHRGASRFFHRLEYLSIPFARKLRGPDFVTGRDLERMQEVWCYGWTPETESALTERTLYGGTLEEASAALLHERIGADARHGFGRRADLAATHLLQACRMGLQRFAPELLATTAALVAEDASFVSLLNTAESLLLLHISREVLEAHNITGIPDVATEAYRRACYLLPDLAGTAAEAEGPVLDALNALPGIVLSLAPLAGAERAAALRELRLDGLRALLQSDGNAALRGAAAGSLFADGALAEGELIALAAGHMDLHGPAFLRGLLRTQRAAVWQLPGLLGALNGVVAGWPADRFIRLLPELRLAFSGLSARETDMVGRGVAALLGLREAPALQVAGASEQDLLVGAALNERVAQLLARDWLADE